MWLLHIASHVVHGARISCTHAGREVGWRGPCCCVPQTAPPLWRCDARWARAPRASGPAAWGAPVASFWRFIVPRLPSDSPAGSWQTLGISGPWRLWRALRSCLSRCPSVSARLMFFYDWIQLMPFYQNTKKMILCPLQYVTSRGTGCPCRYLMMFTSSYDVGYRNSKMTMVEKWVEFD